MQALHPGFLPSTIRCRPLSMLSARFPVHTVDLFAAEAFQDDTSHVPSLPPPGDEGSTPMRRSSAASAFVRTYGSLIFWPVSCTVEVRSRRGGAEERLNSPPSHRETYEVERHLRRRAGWGEGKGCYDIDSKDRPRDTLAKMKSVATRAPLSHVSGRKEKSVQTPKATCSGRHEVVASRIRSASGTFRKKRWEPATDGTGSQSWARVSKARAGLFATLVACAMGVGQASAVEEREVLEAQDLWASGVVQIGALETWDKSREAASKFIRDLYGYDTTRVLFKPTLARQVPFRHTFEGALSYFVGRNDQFPEDQGFALRPWSSIAFHNSGILTFEDFAMASGIYTLTDLEGVQTDAEYSFVYQKDGEGKLHIVVHHSSLPFAG